MQSSANAFVSSLNSSALRFFSALHIIYEDPAFRLRVAISLGASILIYLFFGATVQALFPRKVRRDIFAAAWNADVGLAMVSLVCGSPVIAAFAVAHERWGILKAYNDISEYGVAWWLVSIPVYLLVWDAWFYVLHLVLHMQPVYRWSHANHHAFRPPVAYSGIAIDPVELVFSGLGPYLLPLFMLPFHLPTVYVINVLLVGWAALLHSACPWGGNWLMVGPVTHNQHHARGIVNGNYGAIFKIYDRMFGTLVDESKLPPWMETEAAARADAAAASAKLSAASPAQPAATSKARAAPRRRRSVAAVRLSSASKLLSPSYL